MTIMSHVMFKHIKEKADTLGDYISRARSIRLYDTLIPEEHGQKFGHAVFEPPPYQCIRSNKSVSNI